MAENIKNVIGKSKNTVIWYSTSAEPLANDQITINNIKQLPVSSPLLFSCKVMFA